MFWLVVAAAVLYALVPLAVAWHYRDVALAERARTAYWASMYNRREADRHG